MIDTWVPESGSAPVFFGVARDETLAGAMQRQLDGAFTAMSRQLALHLYGDPLYPRCSVPYAGRCPDSILDAWDAYDDESVPPDTACLCEGGVCRA